MQKWVVENATIVTVDKQDTVFSGSVLIEGDRIKSLSHESSGFPEIKERVNADNCLLMPGLVQAHVHLSQTLFRGYTEDLPLLDFLHKRIFSFESAHDEQTLALSATLGISELLLSGTTSILDMGTVRHTDAIFETAKTLGFRLTSGKAMMDIDDGYAKGLVETTRESLDSAVALAKRWHNAESGRLRYAMAPRFILSCSETLLRDTVSEGRRLGVRLHTHASENPHEVVAVEKLVGAPNIVALHRLGFTGPDVILAHCVHLSEVEREIIRETKTHIAHCPSTNLKLASGVADIAALLESGINIGIGCDGAPCNNRLDGFAEMHLASLLQKPKRGAAAMSAGQTLRMATMGGARLLGLEHEIGSIEVGKKADLVLVKLGQPWTLPFSDPMTALVHNCMASDVRDVFIDGKQVVRNREVIGVDLQTLQERANMAMSKIIAKV